MEDKLIWCTTKEKLEKVARKLKGDGFIITDAETIWKSYRAESVINVHTKDKTITYCSRDWYERRDYATPITADEFLSKNKNPSIVIFRRDRNVIAKNVATGDEGIAKCSPDDDFVFKTGASIALARLMAKTPEVLNHDVKAEWIKVLGLTPVKKNAFTDADRNFKVGDRVVVRDWDDMASEYRYVDGGIRKEGCFTSFIDSMKHLCGRTATVVRVYEVERVEVNFDDKSGNINYFYRTWMFNPIDSAQSKTPEAKFKVGDHVTLKEGLTNGERYGSLTLWSGRMYDLASGKRLEVENVNFCEDDEMYNYYCRTAEGDGYYYTEAMLDKWDESKIHEGDKVRIKKRCTGMRYDTYFEWVKEHITDPELLLAFEREDHVDTSLDFEVVKIAPHKLFSQNPIAYIKHKGDFRTICYLFDVEALEKV